jgi:hypothetical protein
LLKAGACSVARKAGFSWFEIADTNPTEEMTPVQMGITLGHIQRAAEQLKFLETAYTEQIQHTINSGTVVPGWKIAPGRGSTDWVLPAKETVAVCKSENVDVVKHDAIITPIQAKAKGLSEALFKNLSKKTPGAMKLKPDNDNKAKRIFS